MGKLVISTNLTLDGVIEDPMGDGGLAAGGWAGAISDGDRAEWARILTDEAFAASGLLLGARTYDWFASRWSSREGAWADRLRELPKYVASSTRPTLDWGPVVQVSGAVADQVATITKESDSDILVFGSGHLLPLLFAEGLVDELRLFVYPTVAGAGRRLFDDVDSALRLKLVAHSDGQALVRLVYEIDHG